MNSEHQLVMNRLLNEPTNRELPDNLNVLASIDGEVANVGTRYRDTLGKLRVSWNFPLSAIEYLDLYLVPNDSQS